MARLLVAVLTLGISAVQVLSVTNEVDTGVLKLGEIQNPDIAESSGIIPSHRVRNVFWTHNDSGADMIYAIRGDGTSVSQWKLKNTELQNIEDIAWTPGRLYLADVGNNGGTARNEIAVYATGEPDPRRSGILAPVRVWRLQYPGDPFDCESFFVFRNFGYLISKDLSKGEARLYRFPLNRRGAVFTLQKLCKLDVNDQPRGADITPDGRRLAVITGTGAYLFSITNAVIPTNGIVEPTTFVRFHHDSMEGCCFTPNGLLVTSESRDLYLFTDDTFCYPPRRRR